MRIIGGSELPLLGRLMAMQGVMAEEALVSLPEQGKRQSPLQGRP